MIEKYIFGSIIINGVEYNKDVIITVDEIYSPWWRKEGHSVCAQDLKSVFEKGIKEIVIGTGYYGLVKISEALIEEMEEKGIKIEYYKSQEVVNIYNSLKKEERKGKAFCLHLTC